MFRHTAANNRQLLLIVRVHSFATVFEAVSSLMNSFLTQINADDLTLILECEGKKKTLSMHQLFISSFVVEKKRKKEKLHQLENI